MGIKSRILEIIKEIGDPLLRHIANKIGCDLDDLREPMKELVQEGLVRMKKDTVDHEWCYILTAAGKERIS